MQAIQTASRAITIQAPSSEAAHHQDLKSVFLAGTTSGPYDWREALTKQLADLPIIIFNPLRRDWDSSWREELSCAPYKEQVEWELEKQEKADVVGLYFGAGTEAPVSLLELGLCAKEKRAVVYVQDGYKKKGNVQILCQKYGIDLTTEIGGFCDSIRKKLFGS
ncbi:hypothetical protein SCUP234_08587 [Seiridium cupressi]